jgi:hypothetical protein
MVCAKKDIKKERKHKMRTPEERATNQTARMTTDLGLNEKQAQEVKAINLEFAKKTAANREASRAEREKCKAEKKDQCDKMRAEKGEAMKKVLTPEQYAKFEANKTAHQANKHRRCKSGRKSDCPKKNK